MVTATQGRRRRRRATQERKPLTPIERGKLRTGCLRAIAAGRALDAERNRPTLAALAADLHIPKARVVQAIGDDLKAARVMFAEGSTASEVLERGQEISAGWSVEFVRLARQIAFGYKLKRRKASRSQTPPIAAATVGDRAGAMRLPIESQNDLDRLLDV